MGLVTGVYMGLMKGHEVVVYMGVVRKLEVLCWESL